jgi:hypothetical protein
MQPTQLLLFAVIVTILADFSRTATQISPETRSTSSNVRIEQLPTWAREDLNLFLHGSMSTEVVPEPVLRAFIKTYPDLFQDRQRVDQPSSAR